MNNISHFNYIKQRILRGIIEEENFIHPEDLQNQDPLLAIIMSATRTLWTNILFYLAEALPTPFTTTPSPLLESTTPKWRGVDNATGTSITSKSWEDMVDARTLKNKEQVDDIRETLAEVFDGIHNNSNALLNLHADRYPGVPNESEHPMNWLFRDIIYVGGAVVISVLITVIIRRFVKFIIRCRGHYEQDGNRQRGHFQAEMSKYR